MSALPRRSLVKASSPVQDSYLAISSYFRGHRQSTSLCKYDRARKTRTHPLVDTSARAFSRSARAQKDNDRVSQLAKTNNAKVRNALPARSGKDQAAYGTSQLKAIDAHAASGSQNAGEARSNRPEIPSSTISPDILERLKIYEGQSSAMLPSTISHDWYSLRELARGNALDDGRPSEEIELHGFITSQRDNKAKGIAFYQLVDPQLRLTLQLVASNGKDQDGEPVEADASTSESPSVHAAVQSAPANHVKTQLDSLDLRPHTPVRVRGRIRCRPEGGSSASIPIAPHFLASITFGMYEEFGKYDGVASRLDPYVGQVYSLNQIEMDVSSIVPLNSFPANLVAKADTNFPPEQRHLQLRTDSTLRKALRTRSLVMSRSRKFLFKQGFDEIETPLLFKSTPEGAREFIVPTRKPGVAYALPQSPQQYKQLLMASGVARYFQFAKCFRDEDMRADRQPEFTQLDFEMSFARRGDIQSIVEYLVAAVIWPDANHRTPFRERHEFSQPFYKWIPSNSRRIFPNLTFQRAMELYGSDKPDLRFRAEIKRVEGIVPPSLKAMLTSLENVALEMFKIPTSHHSDPKRSSRFIGEFLDAPTSAVYLSNPAGAPGVTVYDPTKPLNGLAAFGHHAAAQVEEIFRPHPGDILLIQARPLTLTFTGGSTPLGNLRRDVLNAAVTQKLLEKPTHDAFVWVTDFPLFSPLEGSEPGQGGGAGICSTHHPFTAPRAGQDLTKLYTDPLGIIGDHYDLVINGVEVGGGSVRIHDAAMQELIFRDVLKMSPDRIEDFRHLLDALAAGCPPHAGFALGFDRLLALLLGSDSVKDVIAFPKTAAGEDKMVSSPAKLSAEQLSTYHLAVEESGQVLQPAPLSLKA